MKKHEWDGLKEGLILGAIWGVFLLALIVSTIIDIQRYNEVKKRVKRIEKVLEIDNGK